MLRHAEGRWERHEPDEASETFDSFCRLDETPNWGIERGELTVSSDSELEEDGCCSVYDGDWVCVASAQEKGSKQPRHRLSARLRRLSRQMAFVLRHFALSLGLAMGTDGFVEVAELLKVTPVGPPRSGKYKMPVFYDCTEVDVEEVVRTDPKCRFEMKEFMGSKYVRATQGHSIEGVEDESLCTLVKDAEGIRENREVCVHGTSMAALNSILEGGLQPRGRNHVHFAPKEPGHRGLISGVRACSEVYIYLDFEKALEDGMKIWRSSNGVLLTRGFGGKVPKE